jgi:hypothetical protein
MTLNKDWTNMLSVNTGQQSLDDVVPVRESARRMPRTVYGSKGEEITGSSCVMRSFTICNLHQIFQENQIKISVRKLKRKRPLPRPNCR